MTRKSVHLSITLTAPQHAYLQAEGARLGITSAEALRRIIDLHRGVYDVDVRGVGLPSMKPDRAPSGDA